MEGFRFTVFQHSVCPPGDLRQRIYLFLSVSSFCSYNGGICVDGVNWFRCECAPGFAGPDCRISESLGTGGVVVVLGGGRVERDQVGQR